MLDRLTEYFFPKQVSTFASDIDNLYFFIFYSSVALFFIVVFGMVYLSIKYRHRKGEELKLTSSKDHSNLLESLFFIIPFIINYTSAAATKILSAIGSNSSPSLDSSLYSLAKRPSK